MHLAVLLRSQVAGLQKANEAVTQRKKRQKKRIQKRGTLTKAEGSELIAQAKVDTQIEGETHQGKKRKVAVASQPRRCGCCREIGHNLRTCKQAKDQASYLLVNYYSHSYSWWVAISLRSG